MDGKTADRMTSLLTDKDLPRDEADRLLRCLEVPDPGDAYWKQLPSAVQGRLRRDRASSSAWALYRWLPRVVTTRRALAAASALVAVVLCAVLLTMGRRDVVADTLAAMAEVQTAHVRVDGEQLWVSADYGVRRETRQGFVIATEEGTWQYDRQQNTMVVSDPAPVPARSHLMELSGAAWVERLQHGRSECDYTVSDDSLDGTPTKRIDIGPGPDGDGATIWVDSKSMRVAALEEWRFRKGVRETTHPRVRVTYDIPTDQQMFVPKPPEGALVIDLRAAADGGAMAPPLQALGGDGATGDDVAGAPAADLRRPTAGGAAGVAPQLTEHSTLTVLVIGPEGKPVPDAQASVWKRTWVITGFTHHATTGRTDAQGRVRFEHLVNGTYAVTVKASAAAPASQAGIEVRAGEALPEVRVRLTKGATIRARVLDEDGNPIPAAEVWSRCDLPRPMPIGGWQHEAALRSDDEGRFVVRNAVPTTWRFFAVKARGHAGEWTTVEVADGGDYEIELVMSKAWSGILEGRLFMPDGQTPVANTQVAVRLLKRRYGRLRRADDLRIYTDAAGLFRLAAEEGIHAATLMVKDQTPVTIMIEPSNRQTISVRAQLPPLSGIRGTVDLGGAEMPPEGLWVLAGQPGFPVTAPERLYGKPRPREGSAKVMPGQRQWEILGLEPGRYDVFTYAPGLASSVSSRVEVVEGEMTETTVDVALPGGSVTGHVTTAHGEPLAGLRINVRTSGGRITSIKRYARTDEQGRYRLESLTPGPVSLDVSATGHDYARPPAQQTLVIPGETIENVDFEMFVGGEVSGSVKRRDGEPLTGEYRVELDMGPVPHRVAYVAADGTFKFEHVYPGSYDLYLEPRDFAEFELIARQEGLTVAEGQTVGDIRFVIEE